MQTIISYKIPVKIFILNNDGYHSIRQTQKNYFENREIGCGSKSGLTFPNFKKLSNAFGYKHFLIKSLDQNKKIINRVLSFKRACICEIIVDKKQFFEPRVISYKNQDGNLISPPLEEMQPFINSKLFNERMIIKKWKN